MKRDLSPAISILRSPRGFPVVRPRRGRMLVLINPMGGSMRQHNQAMIFRTITQALAPRWETTVHAVAGAQISLLAHDAVRRCWDAVVAGGGDGTISCVAHALAQSGVALGVLPLGTRNHFARDVLGTTRFQDALGILARGAMRQIDMGEVNGEFFINNTSIGLYPQAVEEREAQQACAARSKPVASVLAMIKTIFRRPLVRAHIRIGDELIHRITPFVFVGNNTYSLDLRRSRLRPRIDAGELCVLAARRAGICAVIRLAVLAWRNQLAQSEDLDLWTTPEVVVEVRRRHLRVALDGELEQLASPLTFRSVPRALRVIAP